MYKNTRTAEVMVNGEWIHIDPINIKKGMGFRMFEEDGTPVITNGINSFIASGDAFINKHGVVCINTYSI